MNTFLSSETPNTSGVGKQLQPARAVAHTHEHTHTTAGSVYYLAKVAMKFLHSQQILPLLDQTRRGEFPTFLRLAECCVRWRPTEASTQSGFSPVTPPPPHTHKPSLPHTYTLQPPSCATHQPFPVITTYLIFSQLDRDMTWEVMCVCVCVTAVCMCECVCVPRDCSTAHFVTLSSSKNSQYTNIGCTWEQFVYCSFFLIYKHPLIVSVRRFPPAFTAGHCVENLFPLSFNDLFFWIYLLFDFRQAKLEKNIKFHWQICST